MRLFAVCGQGQAAVRGTEAVAVPVLERSDARFADNIQIVKTRMMLIRSRLDDNHRRANSSSILLPSASPARDQKPQAVYEI